MIYLDSAATSLQKPVSVRYAVNDALTNLSSPGRGGYASAMDAADVLLDARMAAGDLLGVAEPEHVVITSSATHSLNIAIKSLVGRGDRVVVSGYEHNAVMRPLHALGADVSVAASPLFEPAKAVDAFRRLLPGATAAVCCHVSNVFGYILPVEEIAALCRQAGVPLIVDMSQSAGCLDIDFKRLGCVFAAMPGHKGLLGPQGTGILLCGQRLASPLMEGGTGSESERMDMPELLPERLEAGTHNMPGIAGLLAGMRWVRERKASVILEHEQKRMDQFLDEIGELPGVRVFRSTERKNQTGVLSLQLENVDCEEAARRLGEKGIAVRAGLHCAPLAHRTAGTLDGGTVRFSFSPFNTEWEVTAAAKVLREIAGAG